MAALKHPCVGDHPYGADPTLAKRVGLDRQWLHAVKLGFEHPESGEYVEYSADYPDDLARALEASAVPTDLTPASRHAPRTCPRSPTSTCASREAAYPRCRAGSTPFTRSRPGSASGISRRTRSGWPSRGEQAGYAGSTRLARGSLRRARRPGKGSGRRCSTWSRPCDRAGSACGSSRERAGARLLPPARAGRPRADRRRRNEEKPARHRDGLARRGATRVLPRPDRRRRRPARRPAQPPSRPDPGRPAHKGTTGGPRREREIAGALAGRAPLLGEDRAARIVHAIITESLDAAPATRPARPRSETVGGACHDRPDVVVG